MAWRRLARVGGYVAPKRYFLLVTISAILLVFCSMIVLFVAFDRPYGTIWPVAAIIAQVVALGIAPFLAIGTGLILALGAASKPKSLRPPNYPRIEHLRIAGKYQAVRRFSAEMGISPLRLT
jgi:hypothetical protein